MVDADPEGTADLVNLAAANHLRQAKREIELMQAGSNIAIEAACQAYRERVFPEIQRLRADLSIAIWLNLGLTIVGLGVGIAGLWLVANP